MEPAEINNIVVTLANNKHDSKSDDDAREQELEAAAIKQKALISLRHILQTRFNESEVRELSLYLGIDYEQLEGNSFPDRIISLLYFLKRRRKLNLIIELGKSLRDDIAWPFLEW